MHLPNPNIDQYKALGESEAFLNLQERISRAAKTNRPVILIGERGTGKELAAARLHYLSARWGQPYVTINCASLTESLIESELFGHEAGAFTGAVRLRKGRFEIASGGTLFLDEIATLPLTVQEKILRVVEYGTMERVGSSETQRVDVRLVAATNVDLRALASEGKFRQDLLDRLSFEVIVLPPLRRRKEDIPLLAAHFARQMALELGRDAAPTFSERAMKKLLDYTWPGNVRELKNVIERMVYRADSRVIEEVLFDHLTRARPGEVALATMGSTLGIGIGTLITSRVGAVTDPAAPPPTPGRSGTPRPAPRIRSPARRS
jgi:psp operon transcriptional activator